MVLVAETVKQHLDGDLAESMLTACRQIVLDLGLKGTSLRVLIDLLSEVDASNDPNEYAGFFEHILKIYRAFLSPQSYELVSLWLSYLYTSMGVIPARCDIPEINSQETFWSGLLELCDSTLNELDSRNIKVQELEERLSQVQITHQADQALSFVRQLEVLVQELMPELLDNNGLKLALLSAEKALSNMAVVEI